MPLTAGTPLNVLVDRLEAAGWGDLGTPELRGLGSVLLALGKALDKRSGAGKITAPQLAERCRYTERWVRRCLTLLEDLEVIVWERGGIVAGKPVPSWIRVSKSALVDLIHIARGRQADAQQDRTRETRRRVARLRTSYTQRPGSRKKRRPGRAPVHAELVTALLSTEEVPRPSGLGQEPTGQAQANQDDAPASADVAQSALARMRADLAAIRTRGRRTTAP